MWVFPQDIGKNIYTIRDVVNEIRDKATRRRLAVLPYELRFKEPFPEYVRLGECLCPGVDGEAGSQANRLGTDSGGTGGLAVLSALIQNHVLGDHGGREALWVRPCQLLAIHGLLTLSEK